MTRATSAIIEDYLVHAAERSELRRAPFDHIYMEKVFPTAEYHKLITCLPDRRFYHELRHKDAMQDDGHSTRLRLYLYPELLWRLPSSQRGVWEPVARALCAPALQQAFKRKFRDVLEERFGTPVSRIGLYPIPILLRDQPGYRIGIHADSPTKAITVQFYLPRNDGQRHLGTLFHEDQRDDPALPVTRMEFAPSSGYAFPVSLTKSWHSAAKTTQSDGERISMMVTYYVANDAWNAAKYRLRRAGLFLGIHPRG